MQNTPERIAPFTRRNQAIDMLRAVTVLIMIFVNSFWKLDGVPHWLEHAAWGEDFMGLADIVFPCFLFAVGMSIPYALENRRARGKSDSSTLLHIITRAFALLVMGAFLGNSEGWISDDAPYRMGAYWLLMFVGFVAVWNRYPRPASPRVALLFACFKVAGAALLIWLMLTFSNAQGEPFGFRTSILGLIAWSYLICATAYLITGPRAGRIGAILAAIVLINVLTSPMNDAFGHHPLLNLPEGNFLAGLLDSIHAGNCGLCACTMGGVLLSVTSARLRENGGGRPLAMALAAAALLVGAGFIARHFFIVSKIAATLPWVCFSAAIATALYGIFRLMCRHGLTQWFAVIRPAGTSTLTAYIVPYLLYGIDNLWGINLDFFSSGIAGLLNCALFSLVCIWVTGLLELIRVKLKI